MSVNFRTLTGVLFLLALLAGCNRAAPANVAATVNGRAITYAELDKQFESQFGGGGERSSGDQALIQKLEVLRTLVDNEIMLQRAEKLGLMAVDADVDAKFNELKAPYTQEEFQKQLDARKMSVDELKAQLRRDLSVQKLFQQGNHFADHHQRQRHHRLLQRQQGQLQSGGAADSHGADPGYAHSRSQRAQFEE